MGRLRDIYETSLNLQFTIYNYKLGSDHIDYVSSQVDLGVTVTNNLLWSNHHDALTSKATSQSGLLMRTCHFTIDLSQKMTFYLNLIRSIYEHCSIIWRPLRSNQISKFQVLQEILSEIDFLIVSYRGDRYLSDAFGLMKKYCS